MNKSSGSKKVTIGGIGLGAIMGTQLPTPEQSMWGYCVKIIAIAVITLVAIGAQALLDHSDKTAT
ncbi:MAG: hypothetical protein GWN55_16595 [Phycisphaerae bacterium]|nr:hypothetical protein [Phycisphaerae bacterium]NIS22535.1 hypothetical protein [candidate division KSB1 bacterium]NIP55107.1 hypothetical protein [Phycisphaerae bacterium]NIS49729.1 hypothetical protein [Phycisphaerae bacterium]NIU28762.1 hypothetical protein [candidate division KSB1 bacterium]